MLRNQCLWEALVSPLSKTQACTTLADKQIYLFHVRKYFVFFFFFLFSVHPTHQVIISFPWSLFVIFVFFLSEPYQPILFTAVWDYRLIVKLVFLYFGKISGPLGKICWMLSSNIATILLSHWARLFFFQIWSLSCSVSFLFTHMLHWVLKSWCINVVDRAWLDLLYLVDSLISHSSWASSQVVAILP